MYRLNDNAFIGTEAERTGNNFKIGSYFIDKDTGKQYVMLFTGSWLELGKSLPEPLVVNDLTVNNDATVGNDLTVTRNITALQTSSEIIFGSTEVYAVELVSPYRTTLGIDTSISGATRIFGTLTLEGDDIASFGNGAAVSLSDVSLHLPFTAQNNYANLNGHLGQAPTTATGSIVGVDGGKHGFGSASFTETFTNEMFFPVGIAVGIGTATDEQWRSSWGDTIAVDTTHRLFGEDSYSLTAAGAAGTAAYTKQYVITGTDYTFSLWVWADENVTGDVILKVLGSTFGELGRSSSHPKDGQWHELIVHFNTDVFNTILPAMFPWNSLTGEVSYFTGAQLTKTSYKFPFRYYGMNGVSGSSGNVSVVSASQAFYSADTSIKATGTLAFWIKSPMALDATYTGFGYNDWLNLNFGVSESIDSINFRWGNAGSAALRIVANSTTISYTLNSTADTWYHIAYVWDETTSTYNIIVNGASVKSGTFGAFLNYPKYIKFMDNPTNKGAFELNDFIVADYAMDESDINKIYDSGVPVSIEHSTHELSVAGSNGELVINEDGLKVTSNSGTSNVNFSSLPTSASGLSSGDLWNNSGVVNIV